MNILALFQPSRHLEEQFELVRPRLYRVAFSWSHDAALADDLVQETLVKGLQNIRQLHDPERLNSWLFSILHNCWRDYFRQHKDMDDIDELEDYRYAHNVTPEHENAQSQIVTRVRNAVERLPMAQRQVVTLVDLEDFSYIEVAQILAIPIGTVMSRLCRARQALHILLRELAPSQLTVPLRRVK